MRILKQIALAAVIGGFFALPQSTHAAITTSYDGCFDIESTNATATIHMLDLECSIEITNDGTASTWTATVANLDPHYYEVRFGNGTRTSTRRGTSTMTFSLELDPNQSRTVEVAPWENLNEREQVTIFAGSDPQNRSATSVPNPVFVDFMESASVINELLFVMAGDVIKGNRDSADDHEFEYEQTRELIENTPVTVVSTIGDHDSYHSEQEIFQDYLGQIPRVVAYNQDVEFFLINSVETPEEEGEVSTATRSWLENALDASTAEYKVVVLHHPFEVPDGANSSGLDDGDKQALAQILVDYDVPVAFVGDSHWYDIDTISADSEGFDGLTGSFLQIVMGGLGGSIGRYTEVHPDTADHFMMMVSFGVEDDEDGISYTRLSQDDLDISKEVHDDNDGTELSIATTIHNTGTVDIPQMRVKFFGKSERSNTYYGFTSDGRVLPTTSEQFGSRQRGYVQLTDVPAGQSVTVTAESTKNPYSGVSNSYKRDGTMTFDELPASTDQATEIRVRKAARAGTITVNSWDPDNNERVWTERAGRKGAKTRYTITGLDAYRSYVVKMNGDVKKRKMADADGKIRFAQKGKKRRRIEVIADSRLNPTRVAALPANGGGSNVRMYRSGGNLVSSFFAFSRSLSHGFESAWMDVDRDGGLELAVATAAGKPSRVRVYERGGSRKAGKRPFGREFTGGITMTGANLSGNGKEMLVVGAKNGEGAVVIYQYRRSTGKLVKLRRFRPFGKKYSGGVNVIAADVNGDGDDELVVAARRGKRAVKVYNWRSRQQRVKKMDGTRGFTGGNTIAAGDLDFDGKDEVIAAPRQGSTKIAVFDYRVRRGDLKKRVTKTVLPGNQRGMEIIVSPMTRKNRPLIVVASTGGDGASSEVLGFRYTSAKKIKELFQSAPLGTNYTQGFFFSSADLNRNGRHQLLLTARDGSGALRAYRKSGNTLTQTFRVNPFGTGFTNGITPSR
jgi:hypothetical protein